MQLHTEWDYQMWSEKGFSSLSTITKAQKDDILFQTHCCQKYNEKLNINNALAMILGQNIFYLHFKQS